MVNLSNKRQILSSRLSRHYFNSQKVEDLTTAQLTVEKLNRCKIGEVAQWLERDGANGKVGGSNPSFSTTLTDSRDGANRVG
ncbi:hypothetical protein SPHINGO8BC_51426 [Sphingobacterium multivorum]|uniref:Uncharacterized protein n=1 Tax=Sphingobacterium multivorum TaxID=28454 RepID=A0A654CZS0_SPHMU|nr:hypothetical protein SPHINGO8BC_51426 [Sphingobacterium multivorum]